MVSDTSTRNNRNGTTPLRTLKCKDLRETVTTPVTLKTKVDKTHLPVVLTALLSSYPSNPDGSHYRLSAEIVVVLSQRAHVLPMMIFQDIYSFEKKSTRLSTKHNNIIMKCLKN